MENYNKTITDFEQIVLHDNVTVGNINTDGDIALMYTDVVDKNYHFRINRNRLETKTRYY